MNRQGITVVLDRQGRFEALRDSATGALVQPANVVYANKTPLRPDDIGVASSTSSAEGSLTPQARICAWCSTALTAAQAKQCAHCATIYCLPTCQAHHWELEHQFQCPSGTGSRRRN